MARVFSSGFELQSLDIIGKEFDRMGVNGGVNTPGTTSTTIKRSGAASMRISGSIPTFNDGIGVGQDTHTGTSNRKMWLRSYVLFEAFPSVSTAVMAICDNTNIQNTVLTVSPTGVLQYWANIDPTSVGFTPTSSALNLHQWYRCEIFVDTTTSTSWSGEFRLDGTTICTFSGVNGGNFPCTIAQLIAFPYPNNVSVTGIDQYYDDVAANDANGSLQNSWPGEGSIIHLRPNAAGDNNAWQKQGGGAGDANNYQSVDEVNPDDATSYLKRAVSGQPIDDYNCDSSASAGIGATDTIKVVQVGVRFGANVNTSTSRDAKLRIKGQSGGTVQVGSVVFWNSSIWLTHSVAAPASYTLTSYTNPQSGAAWTPATLDTMQIGMQANTLSANEIRCSTLWALVEYQSFNMSATLPLTSALIASPKVQAVTSTALVPTSSLLTNALRFVFPNPILPASSSLFADTKVYRPASAVLPCTANGSLDLAALMLASAVLPCTSAIMVNAKFPNLTTAELAPSFTVTAATKQSAAAPATLPATSSLLLNTIQYFVASAKLSGDSSLTLSESLSIVARATLPIASTLDAATTQFYIPGAITLNATSTLLASTSLWFIASASLSGNSTLSVDFVPKFSSSSLLAASSDLRVDTLQRWMGAATLESTLLVVTDSVQRWMTGATIAAGGSVKTIATQRWMSVASLPLTSSLSATTNRYVLTTAVLPASSALTTDTKWYAVAQAVLAATSSWSTQTVLLLPAIAVLPAYGVVYANALRTVPATASLSATISLATDALRYIPLSSVWPASSSLSANAMRYIPATAVLASTSSLSETDKILFAANALLACSSSWSIATTQTVHLDITAVLPASLILSAKIAQVTFPQSVLPLSSDVKVSFTPIFSPTFATLPLSSVAIINTVPKERDISAALVGTTTLLAKAIQRWATQITCTPSSDLSAQTLQRLSGRSLLGLTSAIQVSPIQKMFERATLPLTSKMYAKTTHFGFSRSDWIIVSSLRASTIVHEVENHNKTQKHLKGSFGRKKLKGSLASELEEVP